jgi:dCTP deaminase
MILTDREIKLAIEKGHIVVNPPPDYTVALSSTTLDLTLSNQFEEWADCAGQTLNPGAADYSYLNLRRLRDISTKESYILKPRSFVLGWTKEYVKLPYESRLAARVEGKSSLGRLGVGVHVTAPTIHCGFDGNIQLEIFNLGSYPIELVAGMRCCQLIFEQTYGTPEKGYSGIFSGHKNQ